MFKKGNRHTIDVLFVITLFLVFAFSMIMLTGVGANVYQSVVEDMDRNYSSRTSFSYLSNKIHQYDTAGNVVIGSYKGNDAIVLTENIDNINYCTYLYFYNGQLKELFIRYGQDIEPEYGQDLMILKDFRIEEITDTLFRFVITTDKNESLELFVHKRS